MRQFVSRLHATGAVARRLHPGSQSISQWLVWLLPNCHGRVDHFARRSTLSSPLARHFAEALEAEKHDCTEPRQAGHTSRRGVARLLTAQRCLGHEPRHSGIQGTAQLVFQGARTRRPGHVLARLPCPACHCAWTATPAVRRQLRQQCRPRNKRVPLRPRGPDEPCVRPTSTVL